MASDSLFLELAKAKAQPSRAYRDTQAGLGAIEEGLSGYLKGQEIADSIRRRKLQQQTLSEVLGGNAPEGTGDIPIDQADMLVKPTLAYAALEKATRERQPEKQAHKQQANFLLNGKLATFDPETGSYAPSNISSDVNIAPRVAPTVPSSEVSKTADLDKLLQDIPIVRQSYRPEFVGPLDSKLTALKQRFGPGATPEAATFGTTVSGMRNKVLNLLSGAAISPAEAQRLMQQLPNENMSEIDFNSRINNFERELQSTIQSHKSGFNNAGYRQQASAPAAFGGAKVPSFNTPEEAEASGHKGPAIIGGRRAVIH